MTTPRTAVSREITGVLGRMPDASGVLRRWNRRFRDRGTDAVMDRYPATPGTLHERLSEMLHFDRRGYIVAPALQKAVLPLLDALDASAREAGRADTVTNRGGVFTGSFVDGDDERRVVLWSFS